jgi:hypothetical protein
MAYQRITDDEERSDLESLADLFEHASKSVEIAEGDEVYGEDVEVEDQLGFWDGSGAIVVSSRPAIPGATTISTQNLTHGDRLHVNVSVEVDDYAMHSSVTTVTTNNVSTVRTSTTIIWNATDEDRADIVDANVTEYIDVDEYEEVPYEDVAYAEEEEME